MQELEELKCKLKQLEELSSKLGFMIKETNYLIGVKHDGDNHKHGTNDGDNSTN